MSAFPPFIIREVPLHSPTALVERPHILINCDEKNLYFYQSSLMNNTTFHKIWAYNIVDQAWLATWNLRSEQNEHDSIIGTFYKANKLCVVTQNKKNLGCTIFECHPKNDSFETISTVGCVSNLTSNYSLIRYENYLYAIGSARGGGLFSDVYKLNLDNHVWQDVYICTGLVNEPVGRSEHTLAYNNNLIYLLGGECDSPRRNSFSFFRIPAFDIIKCRWKTVSTLGDQNHTQHYPILRQNFGVSSYTDPDSGEVNVIISAGAEYTYRFNDNGQTVGQNISRTFNDVWKLNLSSLKWTCLERLGTILPYAIENHSTVISPDGRLFIYGGNIPNDDEDQEDNILSLFTTSLRLSNSNTFVGKQFLEVTGNQ